MPPCERRGWLDFPLENTRAKVLAFLKEKGFPAEEIASQGLFTITDRDQAASGEAAGGGHYSARASDPSKRMRVVVTIDYLLD
jgi:hypothetical protein